ncbi:MAG TPA: DNA polymerase I, partial [Hyphomonas sp.]|nr:DNA polymerase I [Hyphomonas sp.]
QARMSKQLATIQLDCPLEFVPDHFQAKAPQTETLVSLLRELEFMTLAKAFQGETPEQNRLGAEVEQIRDAVAADAFLKKQPAAAMLGIACVLTGEPGVRADIRGCALGRFDGSAAFVQGEARDWPRPLVECLRDGSKLKAVQDLKPLLLALHRQGIDMPGPYFDTMVADYLLNPNRRAHTLEAIAMDLLSYQLGAGEREDTSKGPQSLFDVDEALVRRTGEAAAVTAKVAPMLRERLKEQGSLSLFQDVEMPLVPVLAEIERNGFLLDVAGLQALSKELERELEQMVGSIYRLAGGEFNIGSPKQLATVLFETLGLKPLRKTKTGYSTDEDTLTQLASQHELPAQILNYRTLTKLKSTYVDALPQLVNPETKRLHTSLNQTVAATGRLSSTDPNLQNIPVKGDYGLRIREAFIAPPGHQLLCADYSQVEPRILAHLSQDPRLLQVFEKGEDIHMATAMEIFNLPAGEVTRDMRRAAKSVVFGIVYGISPFGLASNIGVPQADAKKYIETFFEKFAAVRALMDRNIDDGKTKGYTTTILGRRRPIPELQGGDPSQRGVGERMAVNSPIQGSAADLIKVAMIKVHQRLQNELPRCKMILQVHDELIFEVPEQELEQAKQLVKAEMEATGAALGLSVPLKVDLGVGLNWRVAHP